MTDDDLIRIGVVTGVHGLVGRLKIYVVTDIPDRFVQQESVFLQDGSRTVSYSIEEYKPYKKRTSLLKLEGIDDATSAHQLKGQDICIDRDQAMSMKPDLDEETFFYADLIGCSVYLDDNEFGTVEEIMEAGSGEILVIREEKGEKRLVPFVDSMVNVGRIEEKRIDIYPVEGLFEV